MPCVYVEKQCPCSIVQLAYFKLNIILSIETNLLDADKERKWDYLVLVSIAPIHRKLNLFTHILGADWPVVPQRYHASCKEIKILRLYEHCHGVTCYYVLFTHRPCSPFRINLVPSYESNMNKFSDLVSKISDIIYLSSRFKESESYNRI